MSSIKYICSFLLLAGLAAGCKKEYNDTSFVSTAGSAAKPTVMLTITQDNTGLVTISPGGESIVTYDIAFGDTTKTPVTVLAGSSAQHKYAEGTFQVKITGHDLKGGTAEITQSLVVSYVTPTDLVAKVSTSNLTVNVSASANYATFYQVFYGDSTTYSPEPFALTMANKPVTHTYTSAGTYIVRVVALSGGSETATWLDTIHVSKQISLPVTFEGPNTDYTMSDFGGNVSTFTVDPTDATNHVMMTVKPSGSEKWAGTTMGTASGFPTIIPQTVPAKMTVRIYSPAAGLDIKLKLEEHGDMTHSVETDVLTTKAGQWETLTFDFSTSAPGTLDWNAAYKYDKASLFFDFNIAGSGKLFYWDDVILL